jgi:hypothetical protein
LPQQGQNFFLSSEKNFHLSYMHAFSTADTFKKKGNIFSTKTWRRETLPATAGWRGGKHKQVGVVAGNSSSRPWPAVGATTPSEHRQ